MRAIRCHQHRIPGEEFAPLHPMQHARPREMPADAVQIDPRQHRARLACPPLDMRIILRDPFGIIGMGQHRAIKDPPPARHCRIGMRMRNRHRRQPAQRLDHRDGRCVQQCDAIPQHIPAGRADQKCPLPNPHLRHGADAHQVRRDLADYVIMSRHQRIGRHPCLSACGHELSGIVADGASFRRLIRPRPLYRTGFADIPGHHILSSVR